MVYITCIFWHSSLQELESPLNDNVFYNHSPYFHDLQLEVIFNFTCFRDLGSGWNDLPSNSFENFHDMVHVFLGGHMSGIPCASVDPIFFLHHTYIDLIWEEFRQEHQLTDILREYPLTNLGNYLFMLFIYIILLNY